MHSLNFLTDTMHCTNGKTYTAHSGIDVAAAMSPRVLVNGNVAAPPPSSLGQVVMYKGNRPPSATQLHATSVRTGQPVPLTDDAAFMEYTAALAAEINKAAKDYPHECPRCGGRAYVGLNKVECYLGKNGSGCK